MKKILLSTLAAGALTYASAESYIGFGAYTTAGTHTSTVTSFLGHETSTDTDVDGFANSIKFGSDNGSSRWEIGYTTMDVEPTDGGTKENFYGLDLDWVKPFSSSAFKPYITLGLGYHIWDGYTVETVDGDTKDRASYSLNYGAGILLTMGAIELDVAVKGKNYYWEELTDGWNDYSAETTTAGLYAGVNLRF